MTGLAERASSAAEDESLVVIETRHGHLKIPAGMLALWNEYGWPSDSTIRQMASEARYRP